MCSYLCSNCRGWEKLQKCHCTGLWLSMSGLKLTAQNSSLPNYTYMLSLYEPPHDKTNKMPVLPAKTQISLGIRPVWSESSLCAQWAAKDPSFLRADSEDSDQPGRMPRLIWVIAGRTCHFVGFVMMWLICNYWVLRYNGHFVVLNRMSMSCGHGHQSLFFIAYTSDTKCFVSF